MARSSMSVTTDKRALQRLDRQLTQYLPKEVNRALAEQMPKIGAQWQGTARALVRRRTGELSNAISYRVDSGGLAVNLYVDSSKMTIPNNAIWQEFGTINMSAAPYFFAAWRVHKRGFKARLKRASKKGAQAALK